HSLFLHHGQKLNALELLALAKTIEARQHGKSSGIDPATIFHGGLLHYQTDHPFQPLEAHSFSGWLIDTGTPEPTTGQVVNFVRNQFPQSHPIWKRFAQTTEAIESAWQDQNSELLRAGIRDNESLLEELQVVPEKVQHFIHELQQTPNHAAKICGAGSHKGTQGGVLLCLSPAAPLALCKRYGYNCIAINISEKGSQCEMVE
ncbi:MAG: hypothetical protein R3219_09775, partial [Hydrogenovibrio sp.]|nr:hypothetical protein [Hydrogenovibrio sp.]